MFCIFNAFMGTFSKVKTIKATNTMNAQDLLKPKI